MKWKLRFDLNHMVSLTLVSPRNGYLFRPQFEWRRDKVPKRIFDKTYMLHVNKAPSSVKGYHPWPDTRKMCSLLNQSRHFLEQLTFADGAERPLPLRATGTFWSIPLLLLNLVVPITGWGIDPRYFVLNNEPYVPGQPARTLRCGTGSATLFQSTAAGIVGILP